MENSFKKYAIVVDGELACVFMIPHLKNDRSDMLNAALSSKPEIVDVTYFEIIPPEASGWMWDGQKFNPPVE